MPAHQQRVRPDLITWARLTLAVDALAADQEEQVRLEARGLLEVLETGYMPQ